MALSLSRAAKLVAVLTACTYAAVLVFFFHEIRGPGFVWLLSQPLKHNIFTESARIAIALVGISAGVILSLYYAVMALKLSIAKEGRPREPIAAENPRATITLGLSTALAGIGFAVALFLIGATALKLH